MNNESLQTIVKHFAVDDTATSITPFGRGHINTTYKVCTPKQNYLLQKVNTDIFNDIDGLMRNVKLVTEHIQQKLRAQNHPSPQQAGLTLINTQNGNTYYQDHNNHAWRLLHFIDDSCTHEMITDPELAEKGAQAFGQFQQLVADIDVNQLNITIPDFLHLPTRLQQFQHMIEKDPLNRAKDIKHEIKSVQQMQDHLSRTQQLADNGTLPQRVTHNDTKLNNVLFSKTGEALCVIDLDTVMPGLVQFDFSDIIRTAANRALEDERDLSQVGLNPTLFTAITRGFLSATCNVLTKAEIELLAPAAHLMPFMLSTRFLTDYLQGDTYFRIHRPGQNLDRARCQLKLSQDIAQQMDELQQSVERIVATC